MKEITIRKIKKPSILDNFEIIRFEDLLVDKNMEEGLHRHDFFFLMVLEKAGGKHHIDFNNYPVSSNTITLIRPGQVHELILEKGSKGYLVTFNSSFYNENKDILRKVAHYNYYKFDKQEFGKILSVSKHIFEEFIKKEVGYKKVIKANLDILFVHLTRDILNKNAQKEQNNKYEQEILDKLTYLLEHEACINKQVTEYAKILNLTPYKLNSITKNLLGKTCSQLINEQIILESKRLLLATPNQVNEIAFKLCYDDPAYFIRFFKKHTGYTPKAFRQHFR